MCHPNKYLWVTVVIRAFCYHQKTKRILTQDTAIPSTQSGPQPCKPLQNTVMRAHLHKRQPQLIGRSIDSWSLGTDRTQMLWNVFIVLLNTTKNQKQTNKNFRAWTVTCLQPQVTTPNFPQLLVPFQTLCRQTPHPLRLLRSFYLKEVSVTTTNPRAQDTHTVVTSACFPLAGSPPPSSSRLTESLT